MATYYSIIYINIKPVINERNSIALLMSDGKSLFFKYSRNKISLLRRLIPSDSLNFVRTYLKGIERKITEYQINSRNMTLIQPNIPNYFSVSYLNYLSIYNNNMIAYSPPMDIDIELNQENFDIYYDKYIAYEHIFNDNIKSKDKIEHIKTVYYPKIKSRVNTDIIIKKTEFVSKSTPAFVFPEIIHFIGKNDNLISGQFIDFEKKENFLKDDLSKYIYFIENIKSGGHFFIIGQEPEKKYKHQRSIWEQIEQYHKADLIPDNEFEKVEEYLIEHDVRPFFDDKIET